MGRTVTPTLYVMRGLPAAGKTTWARRRQAEARRAGRRTVIVSLDDLRDMAGVGWTADPEANRLVSRLAGALAGAGLRAGADVIIDACHLSGHSRWEAMARRHRAHLRVVDLATDVEECVARDALRPPVGPDNLVSGRQIGAEIIRQLARGETTALQRALAGRAPDPARAVARRVRVVVPPPWAIPPDGGPFAREVNVWTLPGAALPGEVWAWLQDRRRAGDLHIESAYVTPADEWEVAVDEGEMFTVLGDTHLAAWPAPAAGA